MQHFTILQILFTSLLKYFVEMTEDWSHRKPNTPHLMNRQIDVKVELLIGSNCPKTIMLREVIPGRENERYAQIRTDFGWGIISNVSKHSYDGAGDQLVIAHLVTRSKSQQEKTCCYEIRPTGKVSCQSSSGKLQSSS